MRKKILPLLTCPNSHNPGFKIYGREVIRDGARLHNLTDEMLLDDDDIVEGFIVSDHSGAVFPVSSSIAIMLSWEDVDPVHQLSLLEPMLKECPGAFEEQLTVTIKKISSPGFTKDGEWNRDEMRYYDKEVQTVEQRDKMGGNIKNIPIHRILVPRKRHITDIIAKDCMQGLVLEVGCGNCNTIYNIFRPGVNNYQFIGSDISFKRLMVAKMLLPEGDFIQASALNLPFMPLTFDAVISFGMLHHLPRPDEAVMQITPLVKKGGYFAFHEPIEKPAVRFPGMKLFKKFMSTYEHSKHDGKINLKKLTEVLKSSGFSIIHRVAQVSPIRSVTETLLKRINRDIMLNKNVILVFEKTDQLILDTFGKISTRTGPNAVLIVSKKET